MHYPQHTYSLQGEGFDVLKSGDARVALIGFPSVGKVRKKHEIPCPGYLRTMTGNLGFFIGLITAIILNSVIV